MSHIAWEMQIKKDKRSRAISRIPMIMRKFKSAPIDFNEILAELKKLDEHII